jgi:hypothetical protein
VWLFKEQCVWIEVQSAKLTGVSILIKTASRTHFGFWLAVTASNKGANLGAIAFPGEIGITCSTWLSWICGE